MPEFTRLNHALSQGLALLWDDFSIGLNLLHRELMRTYKRSRIGFGVILFPAIAGSFLALGISAGPSGQTNIKQVYEVLFWLFLMDIGTYPLRLYKRIRPLIAYLEPSLLALATAVTMRGFFLGFLRMIPLFFLGKSIPDPLYSLLKSDALPNMNGWLGMAAANGLVIASCIALLFAIGLFISAFYLSFMEMHQFLPPFFGLLGYVSGYFPLNRPDVLREWDAYNPLSIFRDFLFHAPSPSDGSVSSVLILVVFVAAFSLLLSRLALHLMNRLMLIR